MKVAVVGSRTARRVDIGAHLPAGTSEIVSGGARGVDTLAAAWADAHGVSRTIFLPDYDLFGRMAPLVRDRQIVDHADMVLAFWDGASPGTRYTISYARERGKRVIIVPVKGGTDTKPSSP